MKRKALGKGLEALIPSASGLTKDSIKEIELVRIRSNPFQPRKKLDKNSLEELARSLKKNGCIQPVVVRKEGNYFYLIAGERRCRAAKLAGFKKIPAVVKQVTSKKSLVLALVENLQREDLNPVEEGLAYSELIKELSLTQEQAALEVGKSRTYITNKLRLLKLPNFVKKLLVDNKVSEGQVRPLINLKSGEIKKLVDQIIKKGLNSRQVEWLINKKKGKNSPRTKKPLDPNIIALLDRLESYLGTKVNIVYRKGKGKVEIYFFSDEDLTRIFDIIKE